MKIDLRKKVTALPPIYVGDKSVEEVKTYKLLGIWIDADLKWVTNTAYIIKKARKRLYLLKVLKSYGAIPGDFKAFYCAVIRSTLEYGSVVWHGNLTTQLSNDIERIQKRALRIIYQE